MRLNTRRRLDEICRLNPSIRVVGYKSKLGKITNIHVGKKLVFPFLWNRDVAMSADYAGKSISKLMRYCAVNDCYLTLETSPHQPRAYRITVVELTGTGWEKLSDLYSNSFYDVMCDTTVMCIQRFELNTVNYHAVNDLFFEKDKRN